MSTKLPSQILISLFHQERELTPHPKGRRKEGLPSPPLRMGWD